MRALIASGEDGMSRTQVSKLFSRNLSSSQLDELLFEATRTGRFELRKILNGWPASRAVSPLHGNVPLRLLGVPMSTPDPLGKTILAFDELIQRPDIADVLMEMRSIVERSGYGWLLDQHDAAARDVYTRTMRITEQLGLDTMNRTPSEHPDWVRLGLLTALVTWCAGKADTCTHNPSPRQPQPVGSAAWKPGLVVCGACIRLLRIPRNSAKDRTCDACGTVVTGDVDKGEGIWPVQIVHGAFVYLAGVCRDCRYWEDAA